MSFHRENVIWKSRDGTWSIGFFDYYTVNRDSEDFDPEWDVEYNYNRFNWASIGHSTKADANSAWQGSNPGSGMVCDTPNAETDRYDAMAKVCLSL